jgi:hypothetical protein
VPFTDYFAAPSDAAAARVAGAADPEKAGFQTVFAKNLDPVIVIGRLESVLTGTSFEAVRGYERHGHLVSEPGDALVIAVTTTLRDALAKLDPALVVPSAVEWAAIEEFQGLFPVDFLALMLRQLSGLAADAVTRGEQLYCCWSL